MEKLVFILTKLTQQLPLHPNSLLTDLFGSLSWHYLPAASLHGTAEKKVCVVLAVADNAPHQHTQYTTQLTKPNQANSMQRNTHFSIMRDQPAKL